MLLVVVVVVLHWNACFYLALSDYIGRAADDAWVYSQFLFTLHTVHCMPMLRLVQYSDERTDRGANPSSLCTKHNSSTINLASLPVMITGPLAL